MSGEPPRDRFKTRPGQCDGHTRCLTRLISRGGLLPQVGRAPPSWTGGCWVSFPDKEPLSWIGCYGVFFVASFLDRWLRSLLPGQEPLSWIGCYGVFFVASFLDRRLRGTGASLLDKLLQGLLPRRRVEPPFPQIRPCRSSGGLSPSPLTAPHHPTGPPSWMGCSRVDWADRLGRPLRPPPAGPASPASLTPPALPWPPPSPPLTPAPT